ncbi:MAG: hypothetical protein BA066_06500 [Candidatus Korarchaeota archaeon NZ13-K]|nr:MAG: hypothetical protein BA066_06500 [Candidatus Korarchaeota archaeon NZ13-K]
MLDRILEINLRLRSLARRALSGDLSKELMEEFSEAMREIYEEMGMPDRANIPDPQRADPRLRFKIALTSLSEDLSNFLYRKLVSERGPDEASF